MPSSKRFAPALPKTEKREAGRTAVGATPVTIRSRIDLEESTRDDVRRRLARKVGKYATHVERMVVRFDDINGPKGGIDVRCRIEAALSSRPPVVVEADAGDSGLALRRAAALLGDRLARTLGRAGFSAHHARGRGGKRSGPVPKGAAAAMRDDDGSLIGPRVGRAAANLERALDRPEKRRRDAFVDTAAPGRSASDRRAGYGATAARNTKRNTAGMQAALEDSRTTPSRKSTRGSANRAKAATALQRTAQLAAHAPKVRATRERARKGPRAKG